METLHEVESDDQSRSSRGVGLDGEEDNGADHIDNHVSDHTVDRLVRLDDKIADCLVRTTADIGYRKVTHAIRKYSRTVSAARGIPRSWEVRTLNPKPLLMSRLLKVLT